MAKGTVVSGISPVIIDSFLRVSPGLGGIHPIFHHNQGKLAVGLADILIQFQCFLIGYDGGIDTPPLRVQISHQDQRSHMI